MSLKLGILGAGQLAKMLLESAQRYEIETIVYAQDIAEPACVLADAVMLGEKNDSEQLTKFIQYCDCVLLESEFYSADLLKQISEQTQTIIYPEMSAYENLATKELQAIFFKSLDIQMAPRSDIRSKADLGAIDFTGPYMLKLSYGGYDGYGNEKVNSKKELEAAVTKMSKDFTQVVIVEKFLDIKAEYASMLVKGHKNSIILPTCKTYQEDEICHLVSYPAVINQRSEAFIKNALTKIDDEIIGAGVYAFEFFETIDGEIYLNEAAPRVHNSYHFSIEGFSRSQFDLLIECALGMHIYDIDVKHSYLSMVNILGQNEGEKYNLTFPHIEGEYDFKIHLYGKKQARPGRKLGHLTLYGADQNFDVAKKIKSEYQI